MKRSAVRLSEAKNNSAGLVSNSTHPFICPICSRETHRLFVRHGYWVRACRSCGHRLSEVDPGPEHVDRIYGSQYFEGGGSGYPDYLGEGEILRAHGREYARLVEQYLSPARMLDVGAAAGFVLMGFVERGWRGVGLEPNAKMANHARAKFGLEFYEGTLEEFDTRERFDLVTMFQVVAHFTDIRKAFQTARRITAPSGFWLIETWDRESVSARMFGRYWHEYSPPSTLNYFSRIGLRHLAEAQGLKEVATGRVRKRISGAHAKSLLKHKLEETSFGRIVSKTAGLIPDQASIVYPGSDLFWVLFQKLDC